MPLYTRLCRSCIYAPTLVLLLTSAFWLSACGGGSPATQPPPPVSNPVPAIASLSQNTSTAGTSGLNLIIAGSGFIQSSVVQWNQSNRATTFVSSTELQVALTAADLNTAGTAQIVVVNPGPGGGASNPITFTINDPSPQISAISQNSATVGSTALTLTITGSGFVQSSVVQWNQSNRSTTFASSTQLQVALTAADLAVAGTAQITVTNPGPGGGSSSPVTFTVNNPAPQISGISPTTVTTVDAGLTITVTGSGFIPTSAVTWNGAARTTSYLSTTQLQFKLLSADVAAVGAVQISVSNPAPGGGPASPTQLTIVYPVPVLTSLNPAAVVAGGPSFTLSVNGSGFSPSSIVQYNGTPRTTSYVNSSTLTILVGATDIATPTTAQITVVTPLPGGGTSSPAILTINTYPVPVIASISPASITVNSPDTMVTIQGSGFTSFSTVLVNGTSLTPNSWNPTVIFVIIPAANFASVGSLSVTVSNPGSLVSNAVNISVVPNPVPTLSGISPASAAIGGPSFTLTLSGSNFVPTSVVQWNGSPLVTTFANANQLTATVPMTDTQTLGNSNVTVVNPSPGGGTSSAVVFTTFISLPANALVYSSATQLLYASVGDSGGPKLGNSIVPIDPNTGALGTPIFVGSEPQKMAISSDGTVIWVALNAAAAVREVNLTTPSAGLQFTLGGGTGVYQPPYRATALAVMPGQPNTVAVAVPTPFTYSSIVTIYDSGVARPNVQNGNLPCCSGIVGMAFDPTGTTLYEAGSGYGKATVSSTGIASATELNTTVSTNDLRVDNGHAYLTTGVVLDANLGTQLGVFSVAPNQNANGPVAPDSTIGEAFVLVNPNSANGFQVNAYDLSTFNPKGSIPVAGVNSLVMNPGSMTRWGQNGVAFTSGTQVYILTSSLVRDLSTTLADISVTAVSPPASGTTGANLTYSLAIANAGPSTATPVSFIDNLPNGSTFQSVTTSQGTCTGGAVVYCDLGNLNSGASATVQITLTPLAAGTLTNIASVAAPQGDPNPGNNAASSSVTVIGSTYNPAPALTSISPEFVQAGSASFTLTVNGSGFASNSVVQLNSTALATTFVSANQLTAAVPASDVAGLGWAWISVTSPIPGGGTSSSLALTTYQVVSLDINRMTFDPFTRRLYATVPSTATQVAGNSLIAIDPVTGKLGSPLNVGSGPNRIAESTDGHYLYIGIDGANSLTRVDLTSMTQGPVYPLTVPSGTPFAARDLAVAPGNDNLLAVDPGYASAGIGIVDISGSTATMRPNQAGTYTGSNITFPNASTVYTYDSDTSGAEFYRWAVTSSGVSLINNTGYTLDGLGGFSGSYALASDGSAYGFNGGVFDPVPTPPVQQGQFQITSAEGSGQSIQGSGVAPDPALGRAFYLGETLAGSANPVLLSYDINRYVLLDMNQFTGAAQGMDLARWGRDGLAWHTSNNGAFGNSNPGSGQVFIMRGPFVLPQWASLNPTPSLASVSPSSATAGSGNLTITVTGSNFVPGAVLLWNGAERTTTFVDSSHLIVAIPASDVGATGTATLVVNNPGSSNSSSISFTVN